MTDTSAKRKKTDESTGFSAEERAAMKERAAELRGAKGGKKAEREFQALLDKFDELDGAERQIAEGVHRIVTEHAPELAGKTWYGMPAYARDGNVLCFVQPASKFNTRYSTLGFNDNAQLDDGEIWPSAYAITQWTPAVQRKVTELIKKAVG